MEHLAPGRPLTAGEREIVARLRKVNLDLLPVLHELLRTRSVTRTAQSLDMTQPAVSRALRQLRDAFDDQLLVSPGRDNAPHRSGGGADRPLGRALADLDLLLKPAGSFDPASERCIWSSTPPTMSPSFWRRSCPKSAPARRRMSCWNSLGAGTRNAEDLARVDFMIGPRAFGQTLGKRVGRCRCGETRWRASLPPRTAPSRNASHRPNSRRRAMPPSGAICGHRRTSTSCYSPRRRSKWRRFAPSPTSWSWAQSSRNRTASRWCRARSRVSWRAGNKLRIVEIAYPRRQLYIDAYWSLATNSRRGRAWFRQLLARAAARLA